MNQAPSLGHMVEGAKRALPFARVALVLQGGGALGAYQGGVYQALHEANIHVDWICGTSIGGINGALLAGNPPEHRVERLREFWDTVTKRQSGSRICHGLPICHGSPNPGAATSAIGPIA
jgi:NTE family protein